MGTSRHKIIYGCTVSGCQSRRFSYRGLLGLHMRIEHDMPVNVVELVRAILGLVLMVLIFVSRNRAVQLQNHFSAGHQRHCCHVLTIA